VGLAVGDVVHALQCAGQNVMMTAEQPSPSTSSRHPVGSGPLSGHVGVGYRVGDAVGLRDGASVVDVVEVSVVVVVDCPHRSPKNPLAQSHDQLLGSVSSYSPSELPATSVHDPPFKHGLEAHGEVGMAVGSGVGSGVGLRVGARVGAFVG
jgi:hypothetical protein